MGRPAKYTDNELVKITQDYLSTGDLGKPTYLKLAAWAKQHGYDIGEQVFRTRPAVVQLLTDAKKQYCGRERGCAEGAYVSFDVAGEMRKLRTESGVKKLIAALEEREGYFRSLYERNCALASIIKEQLTQLAQAAKKIRELEEDCAQYKRKTIEYKHKNAELTRINARTKALLENAIYPEIALAELDELGLDIEPSKMPDAVLDRQISDGLEHQELMGRVVPLVRTSLLEGEEKEPSAAMTPQELENLMMQKLTK